MFRTSAGFRLFMLVVSAYLAAPARADNWPQWRGPTGDSVSTAKRLLLEWSEGKNVVWKCSLPDGASTPAIWGDALFVTGQKDDQLVLIKLSAAHGKIEWERIVGTGMPKRAAQRGE